MATIQGGSTRCDAVKPTKRMQSGFDQTLPNDHRLFCSGHVSFPNGDVLIAGGDWPIDDNLGICDGQPGDSIPAPPFASYFDESSGEVIRLDDMPSVFWSEPIGNPYPADSSRYYPTTIELPSGKILVVAGNRWVDTDGDCRVEDADGGKPRNRTWLEFDPLNLNDPWTVLENPMDPAWAQGAGGGSRPYELSMPDTYPHMRVLPSGLLFRGWDAFGSTFMSSRLWPWPVTEGNVQSHPRIVGHSYGPSVVLTLRPPYSVQEVLAMGGGAPENPTAVAEIKDFGNPSDPWTATESMSHARMRLNATLLPNGEVFIVGGGGLDEQNEPWDPIYECEMFDPVTQDMRTMDLLTKPRIYHSTSLLLPDGRVLATGNEPGAEHGGHEPGTHYEIFYPPYLFTPSGTLAFAERPTIEEIETAVFYGLPFLLEVSLPPGVASVDSVMMMGLSSVTHSNDFSQRRIMMDFSEIGEDSIMATAPWQPEVAPPGNYMVIVMAGGVPSVAKFVGLSRATSTTQTGDEELWGGQVRLDRDFTVETGDLLRILPGTEILVLANEDSANVGVDPELIELIIKGSTLAEGTEAEPIHITTFGGAGSFGEWRGIRFIDTADNTISDLEWIEFENAFHAVELDTLSGNIWECSFEDSEESDVYIPRDTRLVEGHEWRWNAPMLVLVEDEDAAADGEAPLLVEVVISGAIRTQRPTGAGVNDRVVFTSTEEDALRGADWHGLTVIGTGLNDGIGVAEILDAEFAYARYPLSFFVADTAQVGNSQFHHYEEDAITDWGSDAWIHDCFVERGAGLTDAPPDPAGLNGIRLAETFAIVERDTVFYQISNGIWVQGSQGYCLMSNPPPATAGTVTLRENVIVGDPLVSNTTCNGILAGWVCHEQRVVIEDSNIQNWRGRGVRLDNCSDALLECNCIMGNQVGFKHDRKYRTVNATNGINKVRENNFDDSVDANVKTGLGPGNNSSGLWVGLSGDESVGRNRLELLNEFAHNYDLDAFEYYRMDSLEVNIWYDKDDQILNSEASINSWNDYSPEPSPLEQVLDVSGYLTSSNDDPDCSVLTACDLTNLQSRFGTMRLNAKIVVDASGSQRRDSDPFEQPSPQSGPERFWLSAPQGNPVTGGMTVINFDVPHHAGGPIRIAVYSTTGQLVRNLFGPGGSAPGRHSVRWGLDDEAGQHVTGGIYFVRMSAPGFVRTEKVVVLR